MLVPLNYVNFSSYGWDADPERFASQTLFDAPDGNDPLALDFTGMGKGEAWVNGQSIGRYWPALSSPDSGCTDYCNYKGPYKSNKCLKKCGKPSQEL